ncbi:MAG: SAM-dependent methyltransferase [Vicinamibacterales bacterium]
MNETRLSGSFRDPAGHIVLINGHIHRRIEPAGLEGYRRLMDSGLYAGLTSKGLLIPHQDLGPQADQPGAATVLRPELVPMVSYPYEWSLSQLRDAALATLDAQREALRVGMVLKDASAYNVQFHRGRPVLIDTLSFEPYRGGPWFAYRQFCQHFYAPLLVAATVDPRLMRSSSVFIDGLPLRVASRMLPRSSWLGPGPLFHIHLHARAEEKWSTSTVAKARADTSTPVHVEADLQVRLNSDAPNTRSIEAVVDSLRRAIEGVRWSHKSHWSSYYAEGESYSAEAFARKADVVAGWLERIRPGTVWDLGANTGHFSKAAARVGATAVAFDSDPACVETLYREVREARVEGVLPLVLDLANPSAGIGWANAERMTLVERGPADLLLALAVTHHLAVGNNVPFAAIADYFARIGKRAIVEFVPKDDPMVQRMLSARADVFPQYNEAAFEQAFAEHFQIDDRTVLAPSNRILYLMTAR